MRFFNRIFGTNKKQASLISAWIVEEDEHCNAWVTILNNSNKPIYKVILSIVNTQVKATSGKETPYEYRSFLDVVPPGKFFTTVQTHHGMSFQPGIEIAFLDATGSSWICNGMGLLTKSKAPLHIYYGLSLPISWKSPLAKIN